MKYTLALLAFAASVLAQGGVPTGIAPSSPAPSGCETTVSGNFEVNVVNVTQTSKRDLSKRVTACGGTGILVLTLNNGILLDSQQRIGSIVANRQFQFDNPPQAGAVYTGGWSNCANNTLAIGGSAIFYQCLSGNFYNIYDQAIGGQCTPVYIDTVPCVQTSGSATAAPVTTSLTSTPSAIASPPSLSISPITTDTVSTTSVASNYSSSSVSTSTIVITTIPYTNSTLSTTTAPVTQTSASGSSGTTSPTESISPFPSNAAGILAKNNEFIALAAGVAALVMI